MKGKPVAGESVTETKEYELGSGLRWRSGMKEPGFFNPPSWQDLNN